MAKPKDVLEILRLLRKEVGESKPVVRHEEPFRTLVATMLSAQTRDPVTEAAAARLFARFPSAKALAKARTQAIQKLIYPVSFYRTKAPRVKAIAEQVLSRFGGHVPSTLEELTTLPGVGRKTANCVLCFSFGKEVIAVDTHVHRVPNRLGLVRTKTPEQTERALALVIPQRHWNSLNELFVKFGQRRCKPIGPRCGDCPLQKHCDYFKKVYSKKKKVRKK